MAKKVKKAKKAKKVSKSKKAKRATAKPKSTVSVAIQSVVQFIKMLIDQGRVDEFQASAKASKAFVALDDDSAEFVRKFLASNQHLRPHMARAIRDPCPGNPFEC